MQKIIFSQQRKQQENGSEQSNSSRIFSAPYVCEPQGGISLNTLLSRLQRSSQNERELQRIRSELERLIYAVRESKEKHSALWIMPGGTQLDPLISELLSCSFVQSPTVPRRRS